MNTTGAQRLLVIAALLLCLILLSMAVFIEVPVSQEVPVGTESVCRCRHSNADNIRWRVNGSLVGRIPPPDITPDISTEDGNLVDTLTIVARLEYNGTVVVCVAEFDDGTQEETSEPPAMLLVQADVNPTDNTAAGAFIESPTSQSVHIGQEAVFRCRHSSADTIRWRVNGSLVRLSNLPDGVGLDADGLVDILTITGRLDYNGTEVECVARFDSGSPEQVSNPPALLIVVAAGVNPTDITAQGFITLPLSVNVTVGTETMFHCEHSNADGLSWFINGTALRSLPDLRGTFRESINGVHTLTVTVLPEYNSTMIECIAFFLNDQPSERTPPALLLIQGALDEVSDLTIVNTTISWEPPFSFDLTYIDPDIVYCVDVYNITCEGRDLVSSDCSVTNTNYTSLSDGYLYEYIVTPRSNVEGAENGTESYWRDELPFFVMSSTRLSLASSDSSSSYRVGLNYTPVVPIPSSYTLSLQALDGLSDLDHVEATTTEIQPNLLLIVTGLESRRLWYCTIMAYECEQNSILSGEMLSTHDFRDIIISSPLNNVVRVTGTFIEGSTAIGVLVIVSSNTNIYYHNVSRNGSGLQDAVITDIAGGEYSISVFAVEQNGLPFERAAMMPNHLSVEGNDIQQPSPTIEYSLKSNSTGVCVQCTFLATDASECIAVVHRPHDLMNIESSHKFTRSGDTASGCIERVNLEDYQVGVIGGKQLRGPNTAPMKTTAIVGVVISVVILVLLSVVVTVLLVVVKRNWDRLKSDTQKDGPAPPNPYEPAPPTNNPSAPLVNRVLSDGGNYDTVIDMAGGPPPPPQTAAGPPPPPQYSTLCHPGTTSSTGVSVRGQVNDAMYSKPAEVSDTVRTTDEQVNHPDIKHEEINGDLYAVSSKPKKESKDSEDAEGDKKDLVYSELAIVHVDPSVKAPPTTDDPVAYSTVQHKKGENGDQSVAVGKQGSGGDGTVKERKGAVNYSTPELKRQKVSMPLNDDCVTYATVKGTTDQTVSPKTKDHDTFLLPGATEECHRHHSDKSSDSGIGHSDSDSHSSTPPSSSDDEESVQQPETTLDPVVSSPVQPQTADLEQGAAVLVMQPSDGGTLVRQTEAYENAPRNFLSDRQVVGAVVDPVRTGDKQVCEGNHEMVPVVTSFQSNAFNSSPHECVGAESVQPELTSEPEQTDYMEEMVSTYSSSSLDLPSSECVRLLRRRRNHESDEQWQTRASMLSESGNSKDLDVTAGKCVTKPAIVYVVLIQVTIRVTIKR